MKRKRLTPSYCFLLGAVLLFAFSGIWHPLLHHVCVSHEKQELPAIHHASPHTSCAICHGMLQSDETPLFSLFLPQVLVGILLAAVAGIMIYLSFDTLLPLSREYGNWHLSMIGIVTGILFIWTGLILLGQV